MFSWLLAYLSQPSVFNFFQFRYGILRPCQLLASNDLIKRMQSYLCDAGSSEGHIHCLPFDILCIIFKLCGSTRFELFAPPYPFDDLDQYDIPDFIEDHLSPWALGQTCRRWREIVLYLPSLWSTIDVNLGRPNSIAAIQEQIANFRRVQICLQRSPQSPLYIRFKSLEPVTNCKVLDLLMSHSRRWYDVELYIPSSLSSSLAFTLKNRVPILRSLTYGNRSAKQAARNVTDTFMTAPSLRQIKMINVGPKKMTVDWLKINDYTGPTTDDDFNIFLAAPNLVHCTLSWMKFRSSTILLPLTQLRALSFLIDGRSMKQLDQLTLPVLEDLRITIYLLPEGGFDGISSLLQRSSCTLKALHLDFNPLRSPGSQSVMGLFETVPKLKRLTIVVCETIFSNEIVRRLAFHDDGPQLDVLLPLLDILGFIIYDKEPSNMALPISMLQSRRPTLCHNLTSADLCLKPLREVRFHGHTIHLSATTTAELKILASSDVDVIIEPHYSGIPPA
jgi:hypothetical protein